MAVKVLNLYAGIGGNRKLWKDVDVTAIEKNMDIAKIYHGFFPNDKVIIADAHEYLLEHFEEFDLIWGSPPCPSHSRIRKARHDQNKPIYPNMKLYEEILLLQGYFKGKWVVENVVSWYKPLIKPYEVGSHYFWSNFPITKKYFDKRGIGSHDETIESLQKDRFDLSHTNLLSVEKILALRNCVEPKLGLHIFELAFHKPQLTLSIGEQHGS